MKTVPVGVSNRHVHLSQEHIQVLFGEGYNLTQAKMLAQPGQFASGEFVNLVGSKGTIEGVRVLGPARKDTQVELAVTDSYKLGLKPPVRDSGDLKGSPGLTITGPCGAVTLAEGAIIAARHIHMHSADAEGLSLKNGDRAKVQVNGPRGGVFDEVLIRVSDSFVTEMHIDTDEANAFGLANGQLVGIILK
ncbi:phosphate propanoyltransferase [Desulfitobacterium chlororespirans]|uniref:Phosphate propanoyltransferase n=1 Tax=Desulfitobacterium chlororespirans DSM 11544 TaxID=1121395 RepID=A0A1M7UFY8_9FIRM|nr:phosphate propanoyltransferase [Desulfitobacterium chlororespirans]SHN81909.1 putative phosphotransacetylase [Desulfitobacterium chlororespirans DSM 11544]